MAKLSELARLIRSKNAGPFQQTLDIMFEAPEYYQRVKEQDAVSAAVVSARYGLREQDVRVVYYDAAYAVKVAFPRMIAAGDIGSTDVFGAQQHAPMLDIEISMDD